MLMDVARAEEPVEHADADGERNGARPTWLGNSDANSAEKRGKFSCKSCGPGARQDRARRTRRRLFRPTRWRRSDAQWLSAVELFAKTASKVSTDLRSWDLFVEEQGQTIGEYPTEAQAVAFAIWLSMRRERVCLAQRVGSGARLTGLVKRTVRNVLTEFRARMAAAVACLRCVGEEGAVGVRALGPGAGGRAAQARGEDLDLGERRLRPKVGAEKRALLPPVLTTRGASRLAGRRRTERGGRARALQLRAQTAPVTERKHFYKTEVHQVQDRLLACDELGMGGTARSRWAARRRSCRPRGAERHAHRGQVRRGLGNLVRRAPAAGVRRELRAARAGGRGRGRPGGGDFAPADQLAQPRRRRDCRDARVGAIDSEASGSGSVYLLSLNESGAVRRWVRVGATDVDDTLVAGAEFGSALAAMPDMDGDGLPELAVAAKGVREVDGYTGQQAQGCVLLLYLGAGGAVKRHIRLQSTSNGVPVVPGLFAGCSRRWTTSMATVCPSWLWARR